MAVDFQIGDYFYPLDLVRRRVRAGRCQWWSADRLAAQQNTQLAAIVAHAYRHVPYYRSLMDRAGLTPADVTTVADLPKLPTLNKRIVADEFGALTARQAARYHPRTARTSGSSGAPVEFYLDKSARALEFVYYWRHWSWLGYRIGMPFAELSSVYFLNHPQRAREPFHFEPLTRRLLLNSLMLSEETVRIWAKAFARYQPRYLKGLASALHAVAVVWPRAASPFGLRGVFSNGDTLLAAHRTRITSVFGCQVLDSYGHMERTFAVSECPSGGYHINSDYGVLELLPVDGGTSIGANGTTRLCRAVGTGLHNLAMPLIKYEVGDLIEVDATPSACACGRGFPLIRSMRGRENDIVETPEGNLVSSLFVVFDLVDHVADGQIVQTERGRCHVRVVPSPGYSVADEAALRGHLTAMLGPKMVIDVSCVDAGAIVAEASGKTRRVISHVSSVARPS